VTINNSFITPSKIVCVGRNYVEHIAELGNEVSENMVVFIKPNSAISNELLSNLDEPLHFEGEICFLYQQGAFTAIGFGLDLTKRQLQSTLKEKGLPWERAKSFDGSAVFSKFVSIANIESNFDIKLSINNQLKQEGSIMDMIYKPLAILQEIQSFMTLVDGDIVMTGTPKGVGVINAGDSFTGSISNNGENILSTTWVAQ